MRRVLQQFCFLPSNICLRLRQNIYCIPIEKWCMLHKSNVRIRVVGSRFCITLIRCQWQCSKENYCFVTRLCSEEMASDFSSGINNLVTLQIRKWRGYIVQVFVVSRVVRRSIMSIFYSVPNLSAERTGGSTWQNLRTTAFSRVFTTSANVAFNILNHPLNIWVRWKYAEKNVNKVHLRCR